MTKKTSHEKNHKYARRKRRNTRITHPRKHSQQEKPILQDGRPTMISCHGLVARGTAELPGTLRAGGGTETRREDITNCTTGGKMKGSRNHDAIREESTMGCRVKDSREKGVMGEDWHAGTGNK